MPSFFNCRLWGIDENYYFTGTKPSNMPLIFLRARFFLLTFFVFVLAGLTACKSGPARSAAADPAMVRQVDSSLSDSVEMGEIVAVPADRPTLIEALKALGRTLGSQDKGQTAGIFSFPIPDSVVHFYVHDTAFEAERDKDSGVVTREMYDHYYEKISHSVDLGEFARVFKELHVDKLKKTNNLRIEDATVAEPCRRFYGIDVGNDSMVRISYGVSSVNSDYKPANKKEAKEHEEDYGEGYCEHAIFWIFSWDGSVLQLKKQDAAD